MATSSARRGAEEGTGMGAGAENCAACGAVVVLSPVPVRRQSHFVSDRVCEVREAVKVFARPGARWWCWCW
jgi:hypothetical protein